VGAGEAQMRRRLEEENAAGSKHPVAFPEVALRGVDVLQNRVRENEVEAPALEGKPYRPLNEDHVRIPARQASSPRPNLFLMSNRRELTPRRRDRDSTHPPASGLSVDRHSPTRDAGIFALISTRRRSGAERPDVRVALDP
jgi:hypothetical protein